jgi:hypothetical protein
MKITRRTLAVSAVASAAALAQNAAAPAPGSESAEQLLQAAREQIRRNGETLTRQSIPMAVEPAFQFKA